MFNSGSSLGQSGSDSVTQALPQASVANPGVPDLSAYGGQQAVPPTPAATGDGSGAGLPQPNPLRQNRGIGSIVPFYGAMS